MHFCIFWNVLTLLEKLDFMTLHSNFILSMPSHTPSAGYAGLVARRECITIW